MMQQIVDARPPNHAEIVAVFGEPAGKPGTVFSWGKILYAPGITQMPIPLAEHELVHGIRQGWENEVGVHHWWDRYLAERDFRFTEELLAHRAEWKALERVKDRNRRAKIRLMVAGRLSSNLYQLGVTQAEAVRLLKAA
jgi:hypothetical protein